MLQLPQWSSSVCRSAHDESPVRPLITHCVNPASHVDLHAPDWHLLFALRMLGQTLPHVVQLLGSLPRFTHDPLQFAIPGGHTSTHAELTQVLPAAQCVPHVPQNCGSIFVSTHAPPPFAGAQAVGVAASHETPHAPPEHEGDPVASPETGAAQALVQLPQCAGSLA